ncbi:MAG: DNA-3-methyladenine glycosylase [Bacteroidia bacterium]
MLNLSPTICWGFFMPKIPQDYFLNDDVVFLSKDLLGKVLFTRFNGITTAGIITETEAYAGINDKASHAYRGRRTARNEVMYHKGGKAYVYLCYGLHHLFNIVTNVEGIPHAVLIRAIYPYIGIQEILNRRNAKTLSKILTVGPGKVSQALGIHTQLNGTSLNGNKIWLEEHGIVFPVNKINVGTRIGVEYAKEDALLPYRFWINHSDITI